MKIHATYRSKNTRNKTHARIHLTSRPIKQEINYKVIRALSAPTLLCIYELCKSSGRAREVHVFFLFHLPGPHSRTHPRAWAVQIKRTCSPRHIDIKPKAIRSPPRTRDKIKLSIRSILPAQARASRGQTNPKATPSAVQLLYYRRVREPSYLRAVIARYSGLICMADEKVTVERSTRSYNALLARATRSQRAADAFFRTCNNSWRGESEITRSESENSGAAFIGNN